LAVEDSEIVARIGELSEEEHRLEREHASSGLAEEDLERLRSLEIQLDQCWDLLRQRRARRAAGQDPEQARVRSSSTVEGYEQ
jgi:hypothetical protein